MNQKKVMKILRLLRMFLFRQIKKVFFQNFQNRDKRLRVKNRKDQEQCSILAQLIKEMRLKE